MVLRLQGLGLCDQKSDRASRLGTIVSIISTNGLVTKTRIIASWHHVPHGLFPNLFLSEELYLTDEVYLGAKC